MDKYIIGLDSGTSSIKAVLFDLAGNEIYKESFTLNAIQPLESWYEEDIDEIWDKAKKCIQAITSKYKKENIVGIGITAQGDGLWMLDSDGQAVRNGICFCDGRASKQLEELNAEGVTKEVFKLTGSTIFTGNQGCILKWIEENEFQSLENAKYIMHLKDVLFHKLTGVISTDSTDQSLTIINMETRDYDDRLFKLYDLEKCRSKYPEIKVILENKAIVKESIAKELNLLNGTIVTSGPMDVVACALGAGVIGKGQGCSIIGSAALHEMVIEKPCNDDVFAGMTVTHVTDDKWLRLMASLAATPNLEWVLKTFGSDIRSKADSLNENVYKYVEELIKKVPIGANGVIYHPYILAGGERAPFIDSNAKASFTGITMSTTLSDILRACYEGVAYAMLDCYSQFAEEVTQITVCGGGAMSSFWCQMFADAVGKTIVTVNGEELGARGAAITNAVSQGFFTDFNDAVKSLVKIENTYTANPENHEKYLKFYRLYKKTYEALMETWKIRHEVLFT
ncbi:MAG: carbohydrate kinase [Spirochaetales bacterium]|nr:carbohydrate kinase [Spirochaetales bacterium]